MFKYLRLHVFILYSNSIIHLVLTLEQNYHFYDVHFVTNVLKFAIYGVIIIILTDDLSLSVTHVAYEYLHRG